MSLYVMLMLMPIGDPRDGFFLSLTHTHDGFLYSYLLSLHNNYYYSLMTVELKNITKNYKNERGTCIEGLSWPPLEPKTEN